MNVLGSPECTIMSINVQGKSSARAADRGRKLAQANAGVNAFHGLNDVVKRVSLTTRGKERTLDGCVLL